MSIPRSFSATGAPDHRPDPFDPQAESREPPLRGASQESGKALIRQVAVRAASA